MEVYRSKIVSYMNSVKVEQSLNHVLCVEIYFGQLKAKRVKLIKDLFAAGFCQVKTSTPQKHWGVLDPWLGIGVV